jgi:hypothetical protein
VVELFHAGHATLGSQHDASAQCSPFLGASVESPAAIAASSDSLYFESARIGEGLGVDPAWLDLGLQVSTGDEVGMVGEEKVL